MSVRTTSKLESVSNIAVIIAAIALCAVLVRNQFFTPQESGSPKSLQGATIDLASLTSSPSRRNLVMFISETCHFCEQEMPFYRTLREKLPSQASLLAVFPPQEPDPDKFLAAKAVKVDHVSGSTALAEIGVRGTPTLLLVDDRGKVVRAWVGAQPAEEHAKIVESVKQSLGAS